jgi:hypothetical protein
METVLGVLQSPDNSQSTGQFDKRKASPSKQEARRELYSHGEWQIGFSKLVLPGTERLRLSNRMLKKSDEPLPVETKGRLHV